MQEPHPYDTILEAFASTKIPTDIALCYIWIAATLLCIYLPILDDSFLRVLFGIPMVLFIPGYALIAALFPGARDIDSIERIVSFIRPFHCRCPPYWTCPELYAVGYPARSGCHCRLPSHHRPVPLCPVPQGPASAGGALCPSPGYHPAVTVACILPRGNITA